MKKVLIAHFSQGGTTAAVAENIAKGLKAEKNKVDIVRIQEKKPIDISGYDCIGIGFPVYFFRMPFVVEDFIRSLPALGGFPFFVFALHGTIPGRAGTEARKLLERKGGREIGYSLYRGDDLYLGFLKMGYLFSADHPSKNELEAAANFGREISAVLTEKEYNKPACDTAPGIVYRVERFLTSRIYVNYFYRYFYRVNRKKCTQCNLCMKKCPVGNIAPDAKGFPRFGGNCISCYYCEMYCPMEAITTPLDWPLMTPFLNYNVRHALKNSSIDSAKVRWSKGKVERL